MCKQEDSSDLGLHCLPMSHKKDTKLIWVDKYPFLLAASLQYYAKVFNNCIRGHSYVVKCVISVGRVPMWCLFESNITV